MSALRRLWRQHRYALLAFCAAALVSLFFLGRLVAYTIYWSDPAHHNIAPQGWMTPGYVGRSWDIPRDEMEAILGVAPRHGPTTLAEIARSRGVPLAQFLADLEAALAQAQERQGQGATAPPGGAPAGGG